MFTVLWLISEMICKVVSKLLFALKYCLSQFIALPVSFPFAKCAWLANKIRLNTLLCDLSPFGVYRNPGLYIMRTDALDRFGAHLEQHFSLSQIEAMLRRVAIVNFEFSGNNPYFCAVGFKAQT